MKKREREWQEMWERKKAEDLIQNFSVVFASDNIFNVCWEFHEYKQTKNSCHGKTTTTQTTQTTHTKITR